MDSVINVPNMTWCFHHDVLRKALGEHRERLITRGMEPDKATEMAQAIADFLSSGTADKLILSSK